MTNPLKAPIHRPVMTPPDTFLSTAAAAQLAGVAPSSVKRWADEGLLPCSRTAGGHRRFLLADVERFLAEQEAMQLEKGADHSEWWLSLLALPDRHSLLGGLFTARGRLGTWYQVADELGPAITLLGEKWARGEISVLEEHLSSERLQRALELVADGIPTSPDAPICVLATAEGDDHSLGLGLSELVLREGGWRTFWVGRATPVAEILRALETEDVRMVAISASLASKDGRRLAAQARVVANACAKKQVTFVMGGRGAWPEQVKGGVRIHDFRSFYRLLRELPGSGETT